MTRRSTRRAGASVLLLTLTLAGCGSGGGGEPTDEGDAAGAQEVELGPLDEYFQQAYGEYDADQADRDMRRVEEIVAECMAEEGFDYTPMDTSQNGGFSAPEELDVEWGTQEFAEQYGYGMTTNPYGDAASEPAAAEEFVDPNAEYVEAMSESERDAYYVALQGDQVFPEEGSEEEFVYDWEQAGCQGEAQHEVYEAGTDDPGIASLEEEMNAVWQQAMNDPRMSEVTTAWVSCMGDAGYTGLATVEDAQMLISTKTDAVYEEVYGGGGGEVTTEAPSEEESAALEAQVQERMSEITEEEIATAVADFECREQVDYDDTMQEVNHELQQEFVDANREELEAWVEAKAAARS